MITYSSGVATLQKMTKVPTSDTVNTALLTQYWNDSIRAVCSINGGKWPFLEIETTVLTVANQEYVEVPNNIRRVISYRYTDGLDPQTDSTFLPRMVFDPLAWEQIKAARLGYSNWPWFAYQIGTRLNFQPIPSTSDNTVSIRGRANIIDMSIADYTTGGILTAVNGSTALVGAGTTWATSMAGRWIKITDSDTANKGDGAWYQIASVASTTALTLKKPYLGTAITAGNAGYTIGQVPLISEAYQMGPLYRTLALWFQINDPKNNATRSNAYWRMYDGGVEAGLAKDYGGIVSQMMEESNESMEGAYMSPVFSHNDDLGSVPYWYPYQQASGFN